MNITMRKPKGLLQWLRICCLYYKAFPIAERKPFSVIVSMYQDGVSDIWYCADGHNFIGLATTINGDHAVLLDYLAVPKRHRSSGYGSAILQALIAHYAPRGIFGEIESPYAPGPDRELRQRRKQFYLDNGLEEMGVMTKLFGVTMEVIGIGCRFTFEEYRQFYHDNYSPWAAQHVLPAEYPQNHNAKEPTL